MGITAISGPHVVFGLTTTSTGEIREYNEERGPSLYDLGTAMMDPRYQFAYTPGSGVGQRVFGFYNNEVVVDYVPITLQTSAIAVSSAQTLAVSTPLTLTTAASGIGTYQTTIIAPETGTTSETLLAIDSTAQYLTFGDADTVAVWNPAAGLGRILTVTLSATAPDTGSITIAGRDAYGFKMTESIAVGVSTQVSTFATRKAFKYVSAVTFSSSTTLTSTGVRVGFIDTFGLPLLATNTGIGLRIRLTPTASLQYQYSSGAITLGSTVAQTATSSDPRGTYASTTASNGTLRVQVVQSITPAMISSVTPSDCSAMFGATHYSSV